MLKFFYLMILKIRLWTIVFLLFLGCDMYAQIVFVGTFISALNNSLAPEGYNLPKLNKKYNSHLGIAQLKSGEEITGKFRCRNKPGEGYGEVFFIPFHDSTKKIKFFHRDFKKITLKGIFIDIDYRKDSTELTYLDEYDELYRKIVDGKIQLFNNCYNIDEYYMNQDYFRCLAYTNSNGFVYIKSPRDIAELMADEPYFAKALDVIFDLRMNEYDLIHFLVRIYNAENPVQLLKWREMKITLIDNTTYNGFGIIQSVNISDHYEHDAYIHFYSDGDFQLFNTKDVQEVNFQNLIYKPIYDVSSYHHFFAAKWIYNSTDYYVATQTIVFNNDFHTIETADGRELIFFTMNKNGKFKQYRRNKKEFRKNFIEYRNSKRK